MKKRRDPTPRKPKKIEFCKKFKNNPTKFFSQPPCEIVLKSLEMPTKDFFNLNTDSNLRSGSKIRPFSNESLDDYQRTSRSEECTPSKKEEKGKLNDIISKLNIGENNNDLSQLSEIPEIASPDKSLSNKSSSNKSLSKLTKKQN